MYIHKQFNSHMIALTMGSLKVVTVKSANDQIMYSLLSNINDDTN